MKQQATQYVALAVHQATLVVSVRDEKGAVVMRATVATEAKAIVGLIRGLGSRIHLVFEEGTHAVTAADLEGVDSVPLTNAVLSASAEAKRLLGNHRGELSRRTAES